MSGKYPMSLRHRAEKRRVERSQSLREMQDQIVGAIERTLQRIFNRYDALIPIPVKAVADRRRSRD
jgi:hypothetical protein